MVKHPYYFNSTINDFCLKLTKESINKYVKKIEDNNINKDKNKNLELELCLSNSDKNPNNNPYILITLIGLFSISSFFYYFIKSKK